MPRLKWNEEAGMGNITGFRASQLAGRYGRLFEAVKYSAERNVSHMDLSNNKRLEEIEEALEEIQNKCSLAISYFENMTFE